MVIAYLRLVGQFVIWAKLLSGQSPKLIVGERNSLTFKYYDLYFYNLLRFADILTVNNIFKLQYINRHFPFLKHKIFFIPNIIDVNLYKGCSPDIYGQVITYLGRVSR